MYLSLHITGYCCTRISNKSVKSSEIFVCELSHHTHSGPTPNTRGVCRSMAGVCNTGDCFESVRHLLSCLISKQMLPRVRFKTLKWADCNSSPPLSYMLSEKKIIYTFAQDTCFLKVTTVRHFNVITWK